MYFYKKGYFNAYVRIYLKGKKYGIKSTDHHVDFNGY